jgi:hypothetical protein
MYTAASPALAVAQGLDLVQTARMLAMAHVSGADAMPITKDSLNGPRLVANLAPVYAWTCERDRALEQLEKVATLPGYGPTYRDLFLNPCWDDLRGDKRFDKIVAAAKAANR